MSALRARASTLLAAASVAGSFFGAKTTHGALGGWGISAMICFAFCAVSAIWVILPHPFAFAFRGMNVVAGQDFGDTDDLPGAYRSATVWMQAIQRVNQNTIGGMSNCLTLACVLLAAEIILWTVSLTS